MNGAPKIVFAGDREISVNVLRYLLEQNLKPDVLIVHDKNKGSHVVELLNLCDFLDPDHILVGDAFRKENGIKLLNKVAPDYIISIHYPFIYPNSVLSIPTHGVLNLHPAYLPFNRGWHTPTWALLDGTPYGATLHFMAEEIDTGSIIHRKILGVCPEDTAHSLYLKVNELEYQVFCEAWPSLYDFTYKKTPQNIAEGTTHVKTDLTESVRKINLHEKVTIDELLKKLRALTTNRIDEAAYFEVKGQKYLVRLEIRKE